MDSVLLVPLMSWVAPATRTLSVTVTTAPPAITSGLTEGGTYGSAISTYTITASGSPTSYGARGLFSGMSVNTGNGQITGIPTQLPRAAPRWSLPSPKQH